MKTWDEFFFEKEYLVLDGALGTCLECKCENLDSLLWSSGCLVSNPSCVKEVHREYLLAGADIITSSAYQISYEGFRERYNYSPDQVNDVLRLSTSLARESVDDYISDSKSVRRQFVAVSIGCYGAHLANRSEYFGNYGMSPKQLFDWHFPKVDTLLKTDLDILAFETIPELAEVKAAVNIIGQISKVPSWISLACKSPRTLNGGEEIEDACRALEDPDEESLTLEGKRNLQQTMIGVNCTSPDHILSIIQSFKELCCKHRRIVAYPNRGDVWDEEKMEVLTSSSLDPQRFSSMALKWHLAGASIIGSCCNTDSSFTSAISQSLDSLASS